LTDFGRCGDTFGEDTWNGAPAEYALVGGEYFILRGARDLFQEGFAGQYLSGVAVSAILNPCPGKTCDDILVFVGLGKTFYRDDFASAHAKGADHTRGYYLAIQYDRAGPATTQATPSFGSDQLEMIPQNIEQALVCAGLENYILSVQYETDCHVSSSASRRVHGSRGNEVMSIPEACETACA
jgi:hypothetical protein